ncbi:hypothetical protein [Paenibacillus humicola]|uniref:hypothetical protein n=1 Tax=Paenibacillus humicola TaxID=3110540 RepID=UPI00237B33EF|nr:hypothetical protein [Paenibacillus humicola]
MLGSADRDGFKGGKRFSAGQPVPADGLYDDIWGSRLPLVRGDRFPCDPVMGRSKWRYAGPLLAEPASGRLRAGADPGRV